MVANPSLCRSTVSRKFVVGLTGAGLFGFVIVHLTGNLLIFAGPEALNKYSQSLKDLGLILWVLRGGLLVFAVAHICQALKLACRNRSARPIGYVKKDYVAASVSSRSMVVSGLSLLAFIFFHLAHYTFRVVLDTGHSVDSLGRHDVYRMVVLGFQSPVVCTLYVIAMACLAFHLSHAFPSVFQTFGVQRTSWRKPLACAGKAIALLIFLAYVSIPVAVLTGCVSLPTGGQ